MATANLGSIRLFCLTLRRAPLPGGVTWSAIGFGLRTTAASLIALYIAFRLDLDNPKWAAMTVWIVAQANRGMSLSKIRYRLFGTVIGAAMAVTLTALFAQAPEVFIPALALWLGLCAAQAAGLRNFRAYGAVLAGYTAAIVAFDSVNAPEHVFDIAMARVIYICLGCVIEAVFTSAFAPGEPVLEVQTRLTAYLRQIAGITARTLRGQPDAAAFPRIFPGALELDVAAEYAAAGSASVRRRMGHLRAAAAAGLAQVAAAQSLRAHLVVTPDRPDGLIADAATLLDQAALGAKVDPAAIRRLGAGVEDALSEAGGRIDHSVPPGLLALDRLHRLLDAFHEAWVRATLFGDETAPSSRIAFVFHVDHAAAVQNGVRTFVAVVAASLFWIATAWPSGPGAVAILSVVCALCSTRPNPVAAVLGFLKGAVLAALVAALCNFAILPMVSDFAPFALVVGVVLVATGLALRNPKTAPVAASFAFLFLDLLNPNNSSRSDAAAFLNGVMALLLGVGVSVVVFALLFPSDPAATRKRLQRAVRRDLVDLGRAAKRWSRATWLSRAADRLTRQAATNPSVTKAQAEADLGGLLAALTIGDAALTLAGSAKHPTLDKPVELVLRRLAGGDPERLARVARSAANHIAYRISRSPPDSRRTLIRGAVLLQEVAEAAADHSVYLGGRPRLAARVRP
jgi:uncharacterized membrane protein YccC